MYIPEYSKISDKHLIEEVIRKYPLAICITNSGGIAVNHFPVILEDENLLGHMAKSNPQWRDFEKAGKAVFVFNGPHAYISPTIYVSPENVPTWNYVAVHVHARIETLHEPRDKEEIIQKSIREFEGANGTAWELNISLGLKEELIAGIVGFRARIEKVEAKFKLSQNRDKGDSEAVWNYFAGKSDAYSMAIYQMMQASRQGKS